MVLHHMAKPRYNPALNRLKIGDLRIFFALVMPILPEQESINYSRASMHHIAFMDGYEILDELAKKCLFA